MSEPIFSQTSDSGTYTVYLAGQTAGEESYVSEKLADGAVKTVSQVAAGGSKTIFTAIIKANRPQEFVIESNGVKALTTSFANGEAKALVTGQPEKIVKTSSTVIMENGVWSQFINLLAQYDEGQGGVQNFVGFLPSRLLNMSLTLEKGESKDTQVNGRTIALTKYKLVNQISNLAVNIWADKNNFPILIEIPSQSVKVVAKGFESLLEMNAVPPAALLDFSGEFTSEEVTFSNGENTLAGTLTIPKNDKKIFPAIVIITGSGSQDRDGSTLLNLYQQVAESLSRAGVEVLRVDDRGAGKSTINREKAPETSYRDLISDSQTAFDFLMKRPEVDKNKIALLGHSEGSETALTIASEDKRVAAIVLLAGSSRSIDQSIAEQELYQRASQGTANAADQSAVMPVAQTLINQFEAAKRAENANNPRLSWFRQHLSSNPSQLARQVKCPVLILQGERDSLVLAYHAVELAQTLTKSGNQNVSLRILPGLTHIFTPVSNQPEEAGKISQEMLKSLQNWAFTTLVK